LGVESPSAGKATGYNLSINISSIELKWEGKINKRWYDNEMSWMRITVWNGRDLLSLKRLKTLMTLTSQKIKVGVNDMTVNDGEMWEKIGMNEMKTSEHDVSNRVWY